MSSVHPAEDAIIERLHSHTDSVDTQIKKSLYVLFSLFNYILRIDLYGKFVERASVSHFTKCGNETFKYIKGQHRWGAASYI